MTAAVTLPEDRWAAAVALIDAAPDATLVCHVAPDGDALGSMLGLARVLRARGLDITCTWGDERWAVPSSYTWLPDIDTVVPPSRVRAAPSLLVVLDTASRDRLGVLGPLADAAGSLVVIDHHAHNSGLDGVQLIDPAAAATAVVVEELVRRLVPAIDADTATLLYVGLVTDTGSFQHSVTTPAVHAVAGRLLAAGARPDAVAQQLWGSRPFGFAQVLGAALSRLSLEPEAVGGRGLVWTWTTTDDLTEAGLTLDEIEPVIEAVRATREADVAAVFKQDADGTFRVSTRSRGGTDVGAVCAGLGGGGHRMAAGYTSYDDAETTARKLLAALETAPEL
ncbi:MAG: bifunctional oligoribonuclease and phosphatase NrnA [Frankiaceae bacterium]|nr:bifunctional oligoribonuclease and phosphatase NrnA [Frankiaceae bacterium]